MVCGDLRRTALQFNAIINSLLDRRMAYRKLKDYGFDESPDNGFSRLQPGLGTADNGSTTEDEKKCLILQKVSGWWVQRSCDGGSPPQPGDDGHNPPPMAVCKTRLPVMTSTSTPDTLFLPLSASEDLGVKEETDYRVDLSPLLSVSVLRTEQPLPTMLLRLLLLAAGI
ncbi:unnamed protein product [Dibothriocephalus latus]|uniref:Uncharacterized protein n=1 Tax=Dibothriocephalus latus TaxID=60516 RepID=A0A3P7LIQ2_DIBLA|nr:unnamed protein product [Dibothriocephalus latus]